jgi:hypothetical protein
MVIDKPMNIQPGELRCPRCFHKDIVASMPRGLRDAVMSWFGKIPRHCRSCEKRFYINKDVTLQPPALG